MCKGTDPEQVPEARVWYRELAVAPIRFYQRFLSPLKPPTCRFTPSCSGYVAGAIRTHGIFLGLVIGTWRILRCQPFSKEGHDPVPAKGEWRKAFKKRT